MQNYTTLVTGANGFVGNALCATLLDRGYVVRSAVRENEAVVASNIVCVKVGEICGQTDWTKALLGIDMIIHLAARVHVMNDTVVNPLKEFRRVNTAGTLQLARCAAASGVKRLVYVSSIKVNGEETYGGKKFSEADTPAPLDAYGVSKLEAEQGLREIALQTGMEVVIIRPPLIYGPGVKANFAVMMRWLKSGVPLPLGAIHNQRSLVSLDNLIDFLVTCLRHPAAANQTFLVSDGEDVSTTELLHRLGHVLGCQARLVPVPASWIKLGALTVGKQDLVQRLCGSLQVDIEKSRLLLGWSPPISLDEGLSRTVLSDDERVQ
jgi:nucleoside-diphosphate-sugar epimerase